MIIGVLVHVEDLNQMLVGCQLSGYLYHQLRFDVCIFANRFGDALLANDFDSKVVIGMLMFREDDARLCTLPDDFDHVELVVIAVPEALPSENLFMPIAKIGHTIKCDVPCSLSRQDYGQVEELSVAGATRCIK